MREHLISAMESRFERVYETCHYVVATALDPRYKCKYFSPATAQFATTEILKICALRQPPVTITASADQNKNAQEPPSKKPVRGYWDCFEAAATACILNSADANGTNATTSSGTVQFE